MTRCMLKNIPNFLWGEAMCTTIYILNRCPTKAIERKNMYETWMGKKPNISHFKVFGFDAYAFVIPEKRKKMDKRSEKYMFLGYDNQHRTYKLYPSSSKAVFISRDVKFNDLLGESISYKDLNDLEDFSLINNYIDISMHKSPREKSSPT